MFTAIAAFSIVSVTWWLVGLALCWHYIMLGTQNLKPGLGPRDVHWLLILNPPDFDKRLSDVGIRHRRAAIRLLLGVGASQLIWFAVLHAARAAKLF